MKPYLIAFTAYSQEGLPDALLGPVADHNLAWSIVQAIFCLQLVAYSLSKSCRPCVWGVVCFAGPALIEAVSLRDADTRCAALGQSHGLQVGSHLEPMLQLASCACKHPS